MSWDDCVVVVVVVLKKEPPKGKENEKERKGLWGLGGVVLWYI